MTDAPPADPAVSEATLEAAMMWRQRMDTPDWTAEADAELEAWLQADERHARAFDQTGALWHYFDEHAAAPEMIAARRALLGRAQRLQRNRAMGPGRSVRLPGARAIAAMLAVAVLGAGVAYPIHQRGDVYSTDLGERRVVTLQDGSRVSLDALSRVSVKYTKGERRLKLTRGQARFDVAKDKARPFSVRAGDKTVVATGTAFNIDLLNPKVTVTLIEGRVLVMPAIREIPLLPASERSAVKPVVLTVGQQFVGSEAVPSRVLASVDLEETTAWQHGKLAFDQEPLADAIAKVNRYSARQITLADAAAGAVPVSGVFDAGDTAAFLEAIGGFLPVSVEEGPKGVTIRSLPARD